MGLVKDELKIAKVKDLLDINLTLPTYQRPYRWSTKSTYTLFSDTYGAYKEDNEEYRLGAVILHKEGFNKYNIVDGQQRITTLSILLYCLGEKSHQLLNETYSSLSEYSINENYLLLRNKLKEKNINQEEFKMFLLERCTVVQIVTDDEQEAFQFFDSQNSRGKELAPHDLLKAYHLREMNNDEEPIKVKLINQWENLNQNDLSNLFENYLYPLTQWYKGKNGLGYSTQDIDTFKGIKRTHDYNYAIYHKASNIFIEQYIANGNHELISSKALIQFQLTHPLIAGKRFFHYILHYDKLVEEIQEKIKRHHKAEEIPDNGSGNIYIKQLYECSLIFFADRFGVGSLTPEVMNRLYSWSYSLRIAMHSVYVQSINKYALGRHERANYGLDMFFLINEMTDPKELEMLVMKKPKFVYDRYENIYALLKERNGWEDE